MKRLFLFIIIILSFNNVLAYKKDDLEYLRKTGKCRGCDLSGADLTQVIRDANISLSRTIDARLGVAHIDLTGANLKGANLEYASLVMAILREANLRNANLEKANLKWADLENADLRGANIREVEFDLTTVQGVIVDKDKMKQLWWLRYAGSKGAIKYGEERYGEKTIIGRLKTEETADYIRIKVIPYQD